MTGSDRSGSPFWRFSLRFYREAAVADACIALQEQAGVDVNLLLFLLWQATRKRTLSKEEVAELDAAIGPWREATVIPLRGVRRALKAPPSLVAPAIAEQFRTKIKAVELEAERLQQEAMYEWANARPFSQTSLAEEAARASIAAYQALCRERFPQSAVETLLAALSSLERKPEE
jgi:uncharacterized protein (TIGR02444 family)